MKKLALAIAAILLTSLAGCAYLEGVKGRVGDEPLQMSERSWPAADFIADE